MDFDLLSLSASISDELLVHLRGEGRLFAGGPRTHATYDTTFHGCFRVEIDHGPACRVGIEHVGGDGAFDWSMAELDRRRPSSGRRPQEGPTRPPSAHDVHYRVEVFDADAERGRGLLETVLALDWGEPTPESKRGRDGVIMSGALNTEVGVRTWATWSPEPAVEPAKSAFFQSLLSFAVDHASGDLGHDLSQVFA